MAITGAVSASLRNQGPYSDLIAQGARFIGDPAGSRTGGRPYYWYNGAEYGRFLSVPGATFTRASAAYGRQLDGSLVSYAAGVPREVPYVGLLIEEARTNLVKWSQDFSNAAWVKTNSSGTVTVVYPSTGLAPDLTSTVNKLAEAADTGGHDAGQTLVSIANGTYTASAMFKAAERTKAHIRLTDFTTGGFSAVYDLAAGTATLDASVKGSCTNGSATITAMADGWFLCTLTQTVNAGVNIAVAFGPSISATVGAPTYTGVLGSGVYVWGAQFEAGSFGTSYIPTTTASVTRAADVAVITNFRTMANGSVLGRAINSNNNGAGFSGAIASLDDGTSQNYLSIGKLSGTRPVMASRTLGTDYVFSASGAVGSWPLGNRATLALRFGQDDFALAAQSILSTDTSALVPVFTQMRIGVDNNGLNFWNSSIEMVAVLDNRLSDNTLKTLSRTKHSKFQEYVDMGGTFIADPGGVRNNGQPYYWYLGKEYNTFTAVPTATFTRASVAYGRQLDGSLLPYAADVPREIPNVGLMIEEARTNLHPMSANLLDTGNWSAVSNTVATSTVTGCDGVALTQVTQGSSSGRVASSGAGLSGLTNAVSYTLSFDLARGTDGSQYGHVGTSNTTSAAAVFDLINGTVAGTFGTNFVAAQIVPGPRADLWRCSLTVTSVGTTWGMVVGVSAAATPVGQLPSGTSGKVYAGAAQFELGGFPTSYIPTTSAAATRAADVATIVNHVPLLGTYRTNLLTYTEQFDNAIWGKNTLTVTPNSVLAPDSTMTADTLTSTGTDGYIIQTPAVGTSGWRTFSVWLKCATGTVAMKFGIANTFFDALVTTTWQRFTCNILDGGGLVRVIIGGINSFSTGAEIYAWGAQFENGYDMTAYMPATTPVVPVVSAASVAVQVSGSPGTNGGSGVYVLHGGDGTTCAFFRFPTTSRIVSRFGLGGTDLDALGTINRTGVTKAALTWDQSGRSIVANGGTVATDTAIPSNISFLQIGHLAGSGQLNGVFQRLLCFNSRLSNSQAQGLTT